MMQTTLEMLPPGRKARIIGYMGRGGWTYRMYQMGLTPGAIVEVVINYGKGPLIIRVMVVEIAIGRGIARRIIVQPL